ncbi:MAG: ankyrin repeat domain-containing protein [Alphaproteobacteria bacterium]
MADASKLEPTQGEIDRFCHAAGEKRDDATLKRLYAAYGDALMHGWCVGIVPAVFYPANWGHPDLLDWFIKRGADIHAVEENGDTILMAAVWHTSTDEVVECLLRNGVDIDAVNKEGKTARMIAEEQNRTGAVRLIDQAIVTREALAELEKGLERPVRTMRPLKFRQP